MPMKILFEHEGIEVLQTSVGGTPVVTAMHDGVILASAVAPTQGNKWEVVVHARAAQMAGADIELVRSAVKAGVVYLKMGD